MTYPAFLRTAILTLLVFVSTTGAVFAVPVLKISPALTVTTVGQSVDVNVDIEGAADLFSFQFDLFYTASVVSDNSVTEGPFLDTAGTTVFSPGDSTVPGQITTIVNTLTGGTGANGNGTLVIVNFTALAVGLATLTIDNVLLLDSNLNIIPFDVLVDAIGGQIQVQPALPEPATLSLLGLGAALMARRRWRHSPSARATRG